MRIHDIYTHIYTHTYTRTRAFSYFDVTAMRVAAFNETRSRLWAFLKRFCSLRRIVEFFVWKSIRGKPRLCRFCLLRILPFPFPLSFHGRYRLPEVKKACREAFCYSTCPWSFRTSFGHVHKSNKCILSKTNIVKYCYTIMPVRSVDHYCENTSMRYLPKRSLTSNGTHEILTIILRVFKTRLTLSRFLGISRIRPDTERVA